MTWAIYLIGAIGTYVALITDKADFGIARSLALAFIWPVVFFACVMSRLLND